MKICLDCKVKVYEVPYDLEGCTRIRNLDGSFHICSILDRSTERSVTASKTEIRRKA